MQMQKLINSEKKNTVKKEDLFWVGEFSMDK